MMISRDDASTDAIWLGDEQGDLPGDPLQNALDTLYSRSPSEREVNKALDAARSELLREEAERVYYTRISETPVGSILLAKTSRGLVGLAFSQNEKKFIAEMKSRFGVHASYSPSALKSETERLNQYLDGDVDALDMAVDLRGLTDFQRAVLGAVSKVPRGEVITYGELANRLNKPNAARAVGQALGRNPIPIVIPCHRVIASDGTLGGYSGERGIATKEELLRLEGAIL